MTGQLSGEDAESMDGAIDGRLEGRDGGERSVPQGFGSSDIELGAASAIPEGFGEVQACGLVGGTVTGGIQLGLQTAQDDIIRGDLGAEANENVVVGGLDGFDRGVGGFDAAAHPPEQVEFPGCVETCPVEFDVPLFPGEIGG